MDLHRHRVLSADTVLFRRERGLNHWLDFDLLNSGGELLAVVRQVSPTGFRRAISSGRLRAFWTSLLSFRDDTSEILTLQRRRLQRRIAVLDREGTPVATFAMTGALNPRYDVFPPEGLKLASFSTSGGPFGLPPLQMTDTNDAVIARIEPGLEGDHGSLEHLTLSILSGPEPFLRVIAVAAVPAIEELRLT